MKTYDELLAERDAAMREASELAMCIWRSEFRNESPEFELCDSPAGVITQIDNMFAGIRQQRNALIARIQTVERVEKLFGEAPELTFDDCKKLFAVEIAEIKAEAGRAGYELGAMQWCFDSSVMGADIESSAIRYAAKIRSTGTWLKDSNVNGGKRQGGE